MILDKYCSGHGCPIREKCARYKSVVDYTKFEFYVLAPYSHIDEVCEQFIGDKTEQFINRIKSLKNGRAENNPNGEG